MKTLEDIYCAQHGCDFEAFRRSLFSRCLPQHARVLAPFLGGYRSSAFAADRELIEAVSGARTMDDVREEVRDFFMNPENRRFFRRILHVRMSTKRLKAVVRGYLPNPGKRDSTQPW